MNENDNLKDQFDTLFDEFKDEVGKDVSKVEEAVSSYADGLKEAKENVRDIVDDTLIERDFEEIDFEDLDELLKETDSLSIKEEAAREDLQDAVQDSVETVAELEDQVSDTAEEVNTLLKDTEIPEEAEEAESVSDAAEAYFASKAAEVAEKGSDEQSEKEDVLREDIPIDASSEEAAAEEDASYEPVPEVKEAEAVSDELSSEEKKKLRKEARNFWLFTALVALIVIGCVLYILQKRGIIFNGDTGKNTSEVVVTTPDETQAESGETSSETEKSTTEEITTDEDTKEDDTSETDSSETDTSESGNAESSSEESSESTSPDESSPKADDVLLNYDNMFVITGAEMVNLRADASTDSRVLAKIPEFGGGEVLEDAGNGWLRVSSGGYIGFVSSEFAKTGEEAQKLAVDHAYPMIHVDSDSLNMRSGPGTDADVLETVLYDTLWEYLGEENGFWHVRYTSYMDGYLSQEFSSYGMYLKEASVQYTSN